MGGEQQPEVDRVEIVGEVAVAPSVSGVAVVVGALVVIWAVALARLVTWLVERPALRAVGPRGLGVIGVALALGARWGGPVVLAALLVATAATAWRLRQLRRGLPSR